MKLTDVLTMSAHPFFTSQEIPALLVRR